MPLRPEGVAVTGTADVTASRSSTSGARGQARGQARAGTAARAGGRGVGVGGAPPLSISGAPPARGGGLVFDATAWDEPRPGRLGGDVRRRAGSGGGPAGDGGSPAKPRRKIVLAAGE